MQGLQSKYLNIDRKGYKISMLTCGDRKCPGCSGWKGCKASMLTFADRKCSQELQGTCVNIW